jgi:hypothetical protein
MGNDFKPVNLDIPNEFDVPISLSQPPQDPLKPSVQEPPSALDTIIAASKQARFIHQIRDQFFYIEIWLYNQLEGEKPFPVPFMFVDSLAIEENLRDWNVKGWIVFNNFFEILERGSVTETDKKSNHSYIFRTDGRNKISLRIYPIANPKLSLEVESDGIPVLPRDKWEMSFDCVIYDIEDLPVSDNQSKLKKCYFWDERYQFFLERNLEWSTRVQGIKTYEEVTSSSILNGRAPSQLNDIESSVPANIALMSLIKTASLIDPKPENYGGESVKIGHTEGAGTIDNPNLRLDVFNPNMIIDRPQDDKNRIFYTSPANSNVIDDMNYVLKHVMSSKGYPMFLRYDRSSVKYDNTNENNVLNLKEWNLISIEELFRQSENEQIERLFIEDGVVTKKPYIPRANAGDFGNDVNNFISGLASRIQSYKFSPMVSVDNSRLKNKSLHYFDFNSNSYKVASADNTIATAFENFTNAAKKGLYSFSQNSDAHVILNINQTKKKGIAHENVFTPKSIVPLNLPQVEMMKDMLFLNQAVSFVAKGLTIRAPGRFIFIDSLGSSENNPFDDRFLGQWMITKVVHLFTKDNYLTEVIANKVDAFSKIFNIEDEKNL